MDSNENTFHELSCEVQPKIPYVLRNKSYPYAADYPELSSEQLKVIFPHLHSLPLLHFGSEPNHPLQTGPLRIGVLFSGGQAPGGHNIVAGIFDFLQQQSEKSVLVGFLNGPRGLIEGASRELTAPIIALYRNQGGFDLLGSSRTKIESIEQLASAEKNARKLQLDGLVIIGGDDSNTNAAHLAEYFRANQCPTCVIGVPKTIDGDLKNSWLETSFGFDSAAKTYSALIGNIARDALSAKKYYHFIKLMGRSASHITLECALQTHPNLTLISEEIAFENKSLQQIAEQLAQLVVERSAQGKEYGVILIPEGLLEFIPEVKLLISELNVLMAQNAQANTSVELQIDTLRNGLTMSSQRCLDCFPLEIQRQLLLERDPHGNVQVSKIETEKLLIKMVSNLLSHYRKEGHYSGQFSPQPHFFGYEGRSCYPSNFDANYCYSLGLLAGLLITHDLSGYMAALHNLAAPPEEWQIAALPLVSMMGIEMRHGQEKPVIAKSFVEMNGQPFEQFKNQRLRWSLEDNYRFPPPIQNFGPAIITDSVTITLSLEASTAPHKEVNRRNLEHAKRS